jgi:hypothetical protein
MGRYPIESWAIAKGRVITIDEPFLKHRKSKVKITADNHNVFYGSIL